MSSSEDLAPGGGPLGLIAGNGRFPFLVRDAARRRGIALVTVGIRGETDPALEAPERPVHWLELGELSRCIELFRSHGVRRAIMAGQVQHRKVFAGLDPDPLLLGVLARLRTRNTDALLSAVAEVLSEQGIELVDSTALLRSWLATAGTMGKRHPTSEEWEDIRFGYRMAKEIARLDIGQTVVVKGKAVVAVEAMEGTDETIRRAGAISAGGLSVIKVARPGQDMRFDVPVLGPRTIESMIPAGAATLAVEAGKCLLLDRPELLEQADRAAIAVFGIEPS